MDHKIHIYDKPRCLNNNISFNLVLVIDKLDAQILVL